MSTLRRLGEIAEQQAATLAEQLEFAEAEVARLSRELGQARANVSAVKRVTTLALLEQPKRSDHEAERRRQKEAPLEEPLSEGSVRRAR
jgi:hypothetical protein